MVDNGLIYFARKGDGETLSDNNHSHFNELRNTHDKNIRAFSSGETLCDR